MGSKTFPPPSNDKRLKNSELKIGILFTVTGDYTDFFDQFFESIQKYFLPECSKTYFLFTDLKPRIFPSEINIIKIENLGFPNDTLMRYRRYASAEKLIKKKKIDALYHLDVDMHILNQVGPEILPQKNRPLIATTHPDVNRNNFKENVETNPSSTAFIDAKEKFATYVAGGFQGGLTNAYLKACKTMAKTIDSDMERGITAKHHDQNHWNKYFRTHRSKFRLLSEKYCYKESGMLFYLYPYLFKNLFRNYLFDKEFIEKTRNSSDIKIFNLFKNHYFYKNKELGNTKKIYYKLEFLMTLILLKLHMYSFAKKIKNLLAVKKEK